MNGKGAVRDQFVRPLIGEFPGNRHIAKKMIFGQNVVVVEWNFEAEHKGTFAGIAPTGKHSKSPAARFMVDKCRSHLLRCWDAIETNWRGIRRQALATPAGTRIGPY